MYKNFFGLKERPFKLVPNPAYLFLSTIHEEALAHLTYAIHHGEGFVLITGEVGTGKTILCRSFLESLDENTEAAFIFNPKLDALDLLKAINDEFGIDSKKDNIKDLIDTLNRFLMEKKSNGKNVLLLIDEAQNLTGSVLEQLRLLSNLETNTSKLLQIILVGQPELGEMLGTYDLRQLAQRITLSCHLSPLNYKSTKDYIRHRIRIASKGPGVPFTSSAFRAIYRYSKGIPRRINIACDRAFLTAFGLNSHRITGSIAQSAIRELTGRYGYKKPRLVKERTLVILLSVTAVLLFGVVLFNQRIDSDTRTPTPPKKQNHAPAPVTVQQQAASTPTPPEPPLISKPSQPQPVSQPPQLQETSATSPSQDRLPVAVSTQSPLIPENTTAPTDPVKEINEFLSGWLIAWENTAGKKGQFESYMSCYSNDFDSNSLDKKDWEKDKRIKNRRRAWIKGQLMDIDIIESPNENRFTLRFLLDYQAPNYSEILEKTMVVEKENTEWKILREYSRLMPRG